MKKIKYIFYTLFLSLFAVSCIQDMDVETAGKEEGFLSLNIETFVSTNDPEATRVAAPDDYAPKTLHIEIQDSKGNVVKSTDDFANDTEFKGNIKLKIGTYTIVAHSANWDGSGSGFDIPYYYGSTKVKVLSQSLVSANVTCTQANVKLTVNYDATIVANFKAAETSIISSLDGVEVLKFAMGEATKSGYIPAAAFDAQLDIINFKDVQHTLVNTFPEVKPREHYILNFKLADEGYLGDGTESGVKVEVDESTNTYTYTIEVPRKTAITLATRTANAWSNFAVLNAAVTSKVSTFDDANLTMQWRLNGAEEWNEIPRTELTVDAEDNVSTVLKGLTPATEYEYRIKYVNGEDEYVSVPLTFVTETQTPLYNGGFENWWTSGKVVYPNEQGVTFWDTSNPGSASFGGSNTTSTTDVVRSGSYAAKLESKYIVIKFAAASIYTGQFGALVGTSGAWLNWGAPFTSRPTALKGWMQYAPKPINRVGSNLPAGTPGQNEMDQCGMFCALLSESMVIDNTKMDEFPDLETDARVIAYGSLPIEQNVNTNGQWKEVNIPFVYRTITKKPTHLLIVFSSSKYGDYFHGGEGSTLYLDDFSFEYGDTPAVK